MKKSDLHKIIKEEISKIINESPYPLLVKKDEIAKLVSNSNIENKVGISNFIKTGNPSELYLEKIVKSLGKKLSDFQYTPPPIPPSNPNNTGDVYVPEYGPLD